MKTLLSLFSTFTLITGFALLDAHHWDAGILFPALAVAVIAAIASVESPQPARRTYHPGCARVPCPVVRLGSPHNPPLRMAA